MRARLRELVKSPAQRHDIRSTRERAAAVRGRVSSRAMSISRAECLCMCVGLCAGHSRRDGERTNERQRRRRRTADDGVSDI